MGRVERRHRPGRRRDYLVIEVVVAGAVGRGRRPPAWSPATSTLVVPACWPGATAATVVALTTVTPVAALAPKWTAGWCRQVGAGEDHQVAAGGFPGSGSSAYCWVAGATTWADVVVAGAGLRAGGRRRGRRDVDRAPGGARRGDGRDRGRVDDGDPVAALTPKWTAVVPVRSVPVSVTVLPPAAAPWVGLSAVTVGAGGTTRHRCSRCRCRPWSWCPRRGRRDVDRVPGGARRGDGRDRRRVDDVTPVAALAPKWTAVVPVRSVPVRVTVLPPAAAPWVGLSAVTVGAGGRPVIGVVVAGAGRGAGAPRRGRRDVDRAPGGARRGGGRDRGRVDDGDPGRRVGAEVDRGGAGQVGAGERHRVAARGRAVGRVERRHRRCRRDRLDRALATSRPDR